MVPSRNLTVRAVPVEATAVAPSRANAPDKVTNELSATQRSLNSRRLSDRVPLLLTALFLRLQVRSEDRSAELYSAMAAAKRAGASPHRIVFQRLGTPKSHKSRMHVVAAAPAQMVHALRLRSGTWMSTVRESSGRPMSRFDTLPPIPSPQFTSA